MSYNTPNGRAYTLSDLEKLVSIQAFGQFNGAISGLIQHVKIVESQIKEKTLETESYRQQLLDLRAEVNNLKK